MELAHRATQSHRAEEARQRRATLTDFRPWAGNPVGFVTDVLGQHPWHMQCAILESVRDNARTVVRSCHGSGKTWCAAQCCLWFLLTHPGSCVVTTAPSGRQVRDLLWREIRTSFGNSLVPLLGRCLTTKLDIESDWYATGFATDRPVNFQGPHSPKGVLFVGDEASGLAEWVFETVQGFMTQDNARQCLIGNPNYAAGTFYEAFTNPRWTSFHISAFDVPVELLRADWKEEMLQDYGPDSATYQVRVLGNFPPQGPNAIFNLAWIEAAESRVPILEGEPEMGVDIARYGDDESVATVRMGTAVLEQVYWSGADTVESAGHCAAIANRWNVKKIKVDEVGIGAGVVDTLKRQRFEVVPVNVGRSSRFKADYFDLRMELYGLLADRFRDGEISLPGRDPLLRNQLTALTTSFTVKGQKRLIGKEDMRKDREGSLGWKSPDRADSLMLAFAEDVGTPPPVAVSGPPRKSPYSGAGWPTS